MLLDLTSNDFQMDHQKLDIILENKIEVIKKCQKQKLFF